QAALRRRAGSAGANHRTLANEFHPQHGHRYARQYRWRRNDAVWQSTIQRDFRLEIAQGTRCLERPRRSYRHIFRKQLCHGKRSAVPGHYRSRRLIERILYAERTGKQRLRNARQRTGESETWTDRNTREPYAGRPRYLLPRWEHSEVVPSYRDQATVDSIGRHEHPESSATSGSQF